ncbi:MAG: hypothetical protein IKM11_02830 [Oscillospiraceae bacterium]|nr:hypothetical protein [Oscillospiraceae bacterium]
MSKKHAHHKQDAQRQEQERIALSRIFNTFLIGLAAECYLFIVYRGYIAGSIDSLLMWDNILHILKWLGLVALAGGCGVAIAKKNDAKLRTSGIISAIAGAFFAVSGWVMTSFFDTGVLTMCTIVPILTVLMLIFFLYQRDCFASTVLLSGSLFTIWVCEKGLIGLWRTAVVAGAVAVIAALAVFALLIRVMQKNDGKLGKWQIMLPECNYPVLYAVTAVCVAVIALTLLVPAISYYLVWAAVIALFAVLAYYTTKLM